MKRNFFIFLLVIVASSCEKSQEILPPIVGKWEHTYEVQYLNQNGTWSEWIPINTLLALPSYEFTKKGRFLYDGKIYEACCLPGSFFTLNGDQIAFHFENTPDCRTVKCANKNEKTVVSVDETTLILIEQSGRIKNKYRRTM